MRVAGVECREVRQRLDSLETGEVPGTEASRCRSHLAECPACRAYQADLALLRARLAALPAPEPEPAWIAGVLRRATAGRRPRRHAARLRWAAVAAAVAVTAILLTQWPEPPAPSAGEAVVLTGSNGAVHTVGIAIDSPRALDGVSFTVLVPDGFEVDGYPSRRELNWEGRLEPGANRLSLPLRAMGGGTGEVVTRIEYAGGGRELRLPVTTQPAEGRM